GRRGAAADPARARLGRDGARRRGLAGPRRRRRRPEIRGLAQVPARARGLRARTARLRARAADPRRGRAPLARTMLQRAELERLESAPVSTEALTLIRQEWEEASR